jgi:hypothetical protein
MFYVTVVIESIDLTHCPKCMRSRRDASLLASDHYYSAEKVEGGRETEELISVGTCSWHYSNPIPKGIAEGEGWVGEERSICYRYPNTIRLVDTLNR